MPREKPQEWKIRQYYEQEELIERVLNFCEYREVAPTYEQGYGKRPDAINFPGDFQQFVENGAVAFHTSVEKWRNPLLIDQVNDLNNLRTDWDLVIDIDCDHSFKIAKETAKLVIKELRDHGIDNISIKFSGNRGFHIGIRNEAFPDKVEGNPIEKIYPQLPRGIIDYIRNNVEEQLKQIIRDHGLQSEMETEDGENPFAVADIENDWGSRHLFRMPYSLHDGSWLVSKPIKINEIDEFEKKNAEIDKITFENSFLHEFEKGEATNLVMQAQDFLESRKENRLEEIEKNRESSFDSPEDAIPEKYFPPTIKNILEGLKDGRKRGLFILINFYNVTGYSWPDIEKKIYEWNERNHEKLRESYVKSQLNWHKKRDEDVPPPNYDSNGYYKDMNVYEGTKLEESVANPVSYAFKRKRDIEGSESESNKNEEEDKEIFECPHCGKEYKMESYFKKHVQECFE